MGLQKRLFNDYLSKFDLRIPRVLQRTYHKDY
jgi:hypothetical protein